MDKQNGNKRFIELAKLMSIKLANSCSTRFIKSNYEDIINEQSSFHSEIELLKEKINDYEKQLASISKLKKFKDICEEQEKSIENLEKVIQSIKDENINTDLKDALIKNEEFKSQIESIIKNKNKLSSDLEKIQHTNDKNKNEISKLNNKISELKNKTYGEIIETQKLRKLLYDKKIQIKQLEEEKKELKFATRRLENRLLMSGKLIGLSIPIRSMDDMETENGNSIQFQVEIRKMNLELGKRIERIKTLEFEIKELNNKLAQSDSADLQFLNENIKEDLEKKNAIILDFKTLRKKLIVQTKNLQNRITDLQNKLSIRTNEVEENQKVINELETAIKTGIKDSTARDIIAKLQDDNHKFRADIKAMDTAIRGQDKTNFGRQQQIKTLKNQLNKLFSQSKWQLSQLHQYHSILEEAGIDPSTYGLDTNKITADFKLATQSDDGTSSIGADISKKDKQIRQLEKYASELENEVNEIKFRLMSRDVKINELEEIINDVKDQISHKGIKIKT